MKVLHININYLTSPLHQTMMGHLNELDIDNKVFAPTYDISRAVIKPISCVTPSQCFKKNDRFVYHLKQMKIKNAVEKNYDVKQFDCIHAYTLFSDGNVAMNLSKKYDIPYVVAVRNTDVNDFFKKMIHLRPLGVRILRNASAVFFLSPAYKNKVIDNIVPLKYKGEIEAKSYIVPNGINEFWLNNQPEANNIGIRQDEILRLIYAGTIDKNKNIGLTQSAMKILKERGLRSKLTVVGRIADEHEYQKIVADEDTVILPPCDKEELIKMYRQNDIFVMPSHYESFGLVYAEAMSQGLPVIYTKGQGFDGHFEDGMVGYSVSDTNPIDLADKIVLCNNNYEKISRTALDRARRFTWEEICLLYRELYYSLCG